MIDTMEEDNTEDFLEEAVDSGQYFDEFMNIADALSDIEMKDVSANHAMWLAIKIIAISIWIIATIFAYFEGGALSLLFVVGVPFVAYFLYVIVHN